jgi:hypothetical protein
MGTLLDGYIFSNRKKARAAWRRNLATGLNPWNKGEKGKSARQGTTEGCVAYAVTPPLGIFGHFIVIVSRINLWFTCNDFDNRGSSI